MHRLPPLNALRAFEAAARHGSFTLAADELCVTPGAISRQVRALEDHLGLALFERANRRVTLTEPGARYFALIAEPFAELGRAGQVLRQESARRWVRLDCVPTLAMHWLLARLPGFRSRHPGTEVSLHTSTGAVNLAQDFDFAIRRDPTHFAGLAATPLMTEWSLPVCSPDFARAHRMGGPRDLSGVTTLHIRAREDLWPSWCRANGLAAADLGERLVVDHTFVAMQAAEDGLGVAVVPRLFVERALNAGRLVEALPDRAAATGTYSLLRRPGPVIGAAEDFRRWLEAESAAELTPG